MNRVGLEAMVAERAGLPRTTVTDVMSNTLEVIAEQLAKGDDVRLVGFGAFGLRSRKARTGKNPKTGETIDIPASKKPTFRAGKNLIKAVNG